MRSGQSAGWMVELYNASTLAEMGWGLTAAFGRNCRCMRQGAVQGCVPSAFNWLLTVTGRTCVHKMQPLLFCPTNSMPQHNLQ